MLSWNYILQIYSYLYLLAHSIHIFMMVCGKAKILYNVNYVALAMNMAKGLTKDNQPSSTIAMLAYYQ